MLTEDNFFANNPKIGIIGLGLIGGSCAKAFKQNTSFSVLGLDKNKEVIKNAVFSGAIDAEIESLCECDIIISALYPKATADFFEARCGEIKKGAVVTDFCGIKSYVANRIEPIAEKCGFCYMGAHPMAGIERFGFENSKPDLFEGASLIVTPPPNVPETAVNYLWSVLKQLGFAHLEVTTPKIHDEVIAFTSQLAHVVSSAYIQSPSAMKQYGFSAGSFKDMTRVARLNEQMWTELFVENKEPLAKEIGGLIERLSEFKEVIETSDKERLFKILKKGRELKEKSDGRL